MKNYIRWIVLAAAFPALHVMGATARAGELTVGQDEFRNHCAACHGLTGLGDGPVGPLLKIPAPNLALITERNNGRFPFQKVYETIDGSNVIAAHGTRDMPLWGDRYRRESNPVTPDQSDLSQRMAQDRILALVYYIGTLQ